MPCMSFLRNRTVIGVFCILLSVLICFGLTPLFNRAVSQKVEIVRVTQPIRAGEQITDDMVQLVQVGGYNLPDNVLHEKGNAIDRQPMNGGNGIGYQQGIAYTLTATDHLSGYPDKRSNPED